jgi:hypothetical protein
MGEAAMTNRDWWPFTRITITAAALGLGAHFYLGWEVRPRELLTVPGQVFGVLSILAMISFVLADLYLLVFLIPLYFIALLNDYAYRFSRFVLRKVFGLRPGPSLALAGLTGEIFLFGITAVLVVRFARHL